MFNPKDSKTRGYHLFLLPQGELFNILQNVINSLAEKYNGPKFKPHVTLLARIPEADELELMDKTKKLVSSMKLFEIELKEVVAQDAYFQALYCKAEPSLKLDEYHQKAMEIFGVKDVNIYPHLSLYYGNVSQYIKDEMIQSLSLPSPMKFLIDRVCLYRTEGKVRDWIQVGEYMFVN